jgi:hypothetical protein
VRDHYTSPSCLWAKRAQARTFFTRAPARSRRATPPLSGGRAAERWRAWEWYPMVQGGQRGRRAVGGKDRLIFLYLTARHEGVTMWSSLTPVAVINS